VILASRPLRFNDRALWYVIGKCAVPASKTHAVAKMIRTPAVRCEVRRRAAAQDAMRFVAREPDRPTIVGGVRFGLQTIVGFARALVAGP
jgi:hypothetical protein